MSIAASAIERKGVVTFKGNPMTLVGPEVKVGQAAPDFSLVAADLSALTLKDALANGSRAALLIVVPSIDTSVCSLETVKFNRHVAEIPTGKLATYTISVDLPFAQKRWAAAENVTNVQLVSDYKTHEFGVAYGVWIKELGLLARSVFLVDKAGTVRMADVVAEVAQEPDYDLVLAEARKTIG